MKPLLKYVLVFVVALIGGVTGGVLSNYFVANEAALRILRDSTPVQPSVVRASAFELVDEHGKVRAQLAFKGFLGGPSLNFVDGNGRSEAVLQGGKYPYLSLSDEKREGRVMLGCVGFGDVVPAKLPPCDAWSLEINHMAVRIWAAQGTGGHVELWDDKTSRTWTAPPR